MKIIPLSTQYLIERLKAEGISVERKTLYDDIALLNECGYEIMQVRKKQNMYYVSDRSFDVAEIRILIDAVEASSFITPEKTNRLVNKIASLAGSHKGLRSTASVRNHCPALSRRSRPIRFHNTRRESPAYHVSHFP